MISYIFLKNIVDNIIEKGINEYILKILIKKLLKDCYYNYKCVLNI